MTNQRERVERGAIGHLHRLFGTRPPCRIQRPFGVGDDSQRDDDRYHCGALEDDDRTPALPPTPAGRSRTSATGCCSMIGRVSLTQLLGVGGLVPTVPVPVMMSGLAQVVSAWLRVRIEQAVG